MHRLCEQDEEKMNNGKWKIIYNPFAGYIVARVKHNGEIVHSGNLEYYGEYSDDKAERQAVADLLNDKEAEICSTQA